MIFSHAKYHPGYFPFKPNKLYLETWIVCCQLTSIGLFTEVVSVLQLEVAAAVGVGVAAPRAAGRAHPWGAAAATAVRPIVGQASASAAATATTIGTATFVNIVVGGVVRLFRRKFIISFFIVAHRVAQA